MGMRLGNWWSVASICMHGTFLLCEMASRNVSGQKLSKIAALSCSKPWLSSPFFLSPPSVANVELPLTPMSSQWSQTTSLGCMTSLTLANTSRASPTHILSRESGWKTDSMSSAFDSFPFALFLVLMFVDVFYLFYVMALSMSTNVLFL